MEHGSLDPEATCDLVGVPQLPNALPGTEAGLGSLPSESLRSTWQILLSAFIDSFMTLFLCTLPLHGIYFTSFPALEEALKFNKRVDDRRSVTLGFWESSSDANDPLTPEGGILHPGRRAEGPSCLPWADRQGAALGPDPNVDFPRLPPASVQGRAGHRGS